MQNDDIKRELQRLSDRLDRIELWAGVPQVEEDEEQQATTPPIAPVERTIVPPPLPQIPQPKPAARETPRPDLDEKCTSFKRLQVDWRKQTADIAAAPA